MICVEYVHVSESVRHVPVLHLVQPNPVRVVLLAQHYDVLHFMIVVFLHHKVEYESETVLVFLFGYALQVFIYFVPSAAQPQFFVCGFTGSIYADAELVEVAYHVGNTGVELLEHEAIRQYAVLDVVPLRCLVHEVPVHVGGKRVAIGSYVHLYRMFVIVQPIIYLVRETYAQIVCGTLLVEYQSLPTTGTTQVATVIYGQSQMLYAFRLAMQYSTRLDV